MSLSVDDLLSDPGFAKKVDDEWEETKARCKQDAKQEKYKPDVADRFVQAFEIYNEFLDSKKANLWAEAFYHLHRYVECVLGLGLHKNERFKKPAQEVLQNLITIEKELELCMRGIRLQIIEKHRRELQREIDQRPISPVSRNDSTSTSTTSSKPKRYSQEQVRGALDALRLDGKKTNLKLYGMDLGKPSISQPVKLPASAPPPSSQPPPSYGAVTAGGVTGFLHTSQPTTKTSFKRSSEVRVKRVPGDGSCAFRSLAQGMAGGTLDASSEQQEAREIRSLVASELRRCAEEEMTGTGLTVEQLVLMKDTKFPTFSEYIQAMSRSEYAGETEFWLLARKLGINIAIYQPGSGGYDHLITYGDERSEPVMLLWQRGRTEAGNHYDALLPV